MDTDFVPPVRDVYGYGSKGGEGSSPLKHFDKYIKPVNGHDSLINIQSNAEHGRVRRIFSPAFSDRALTLQTPLFLKHVNKLIHLLSKNIEESKSDAAKVDMVKMYSK